MMWETTVDALKRFCEKSKKKRKVPSPTYSAYMTCKDDGAWTNDEMTYEDWKYAVKLIYEHSKTTKKMVKSSLFLANHSNKYHAKKNLRAPWISEDIIKIARKKKYLYKKA